MRNFHGYVTVSLLEGKCEKLPTKTAWDVLIPKDLRVESEG